MFKNGKKSFLIDYLYSFVKIPNLNKNFKFDWKFKSIDQLYYVSDEVYYFLNIRFMYTWKLVGEVEEGFLGIGTVLGSDECFESECGDGNGACFI